MGEQHFCEERLLIFLNLYSVELCYPQDHLDKHISFRIQLQFGAMWTSVKGAQIGSLGEILLSEEETISKVRYWAAPWSTDAVEFTTSRGDVYGPWGGTGGEADELQVG